MSHQLLSQVAPFHRVLVLRGHRHPARADDEMSAWTITALRGPSWPAGLPWTCAKVARELEALATRLPPDDRRMPPVAEQLEAARPRLRVLYSNEDVGGYFGLITGRLPGGKTRAAWEFQRGELWAGSCEAAALELCAAIRFHGTWMRRHGGGKDTGLVVGRPQRLAVVAQ